jgi:DNA modification methylase
VIHHGDCVEVMAAMEPESVDAIVCDPPYGLEFMGKSWDRLGDVGTTSHAGPAPVAAGERGQYGKVSNFGSGNLKCRKCGKWQWDHVGRKCECAEPDFPNRNRHQGVLMQAWHEAWAREALRVAKPGAYLLAFGGTRTVHRLACAIEDAGWIIRDTLVWAYAQGFPKSKASLKPAWEPIVMARKPGPLRELAIDACRIPLVEGDAEFMASRMPAWNRKAEWDGPAAINVGERSETPPIGRWPANVILTANEEGWAIFDGGIEGVVGGGETTSGLVHAGGVIAPNDGDEVTYGSFGGMVRTQDTYGDTGTYSRFFLVPKADRADREPVLPGAATKVRAILGQGIGGTDNLGVERANTHPTVKPTELMRHLVRLVTPFGGTVLDPFAGSGSTLIAADGEGFAWIGIEKEAEYVAIAEARLNGTQRGLGLDVPAPTQKRGKMSPHVGPGTTWWDSLKSYGDEPSGEDAA